MDNKKALLCISFGTSYPETRKVTIEAIENDLKNAFPDRVFYRAWTSGFIRKKIRERDGMIIPSIDEALEQMADDGITDVLIQPSLLLSGGEHQKITDAAKAFSGRFENMFIGRPLLENEDDLRTAASALSDIFKYKADNEMVVFMGHGSEDLDYPVYEEMNRVFDEEGMHGFRMGTVECEPGIGPVIEKVRERRPDKVYLTPFLIVAGDHANNDMAGDGEDSWKNIIANEGPEVICIIKGLGEYKEIRELFVKKALEAR